MYNWNAVFMKYCDGGSFAGANMTTELYKDTTMHYKGKFILDAMIYDLLDNRGLNEATEVVVGGCSAGGLATFLHCDKWEMAINDATKDTTKVVCMPDSGFFMDYNCGEDFNYSDWMEQIYNYFDASSGLNTDCISHYTKTGGDPFKCYFA